MGSGCCKSKNFSIEPSNASNVITVQPAVNVVDNSRDSNNDEYIENAVCQESEIKENELQTFDLGDSKVLIVKQNGKISALGTKCTHYGAPLVTGAIGDGRIRCPWHGACFDLASGDIEDFPGLDSIPCYNVRVEKGQVFVRAKKSELVSGKRTKMMTNRDMNDKRVFVIVGGGPSGATCAENLRVKGFTGHIILITNETTLPYDRVKLSKVMDADPVLLRTQKFYDDNHIEVMTGVNATALNPNDREISIDNGDKIKYDKIYLATGSSARKLKFPGDDLKNIFVLRNVSDANQISSKINESSHVVILGASFIGMEAASFLVQKVAKVTVVELDSIPMRAFGEAIGERVMKFFEEKNVEFCMKNGVKECTGNADGEIESVLLNDGTKLKADVLIMGVGVVLNTSFLKDSGLTINPNGSIDTNEYLESNIPDVYVGGDIANSPILMTGNREAIGHYGLSQYHGKIAAANMCGLKEKLKTVPFFWTVLFGKSLRYTGHGRASEVKIEGDLEEMKYTAFYFNEEGRVIAMSSCGPGSIVAQFAEFLAQGKILTKEEVEKDPFGWSKGICG